MTQPESLAEVALASAREVMGWDDALLRDHEFIEAPASDDGQSPAGVFCCTDLNTVICAIDVFCMENGLHWDLGNDPTGGYRCYIGNIDGKESARAHESIARVRNAESLEYAVLAACVAASRKLREVA